MPPVWSWRAKPSSKKLDAKAPEGLVTDPLTVTTVPRGRLRAAAMEIVPGVAERAGAKASEAASAPAARRARVGRDIEVVDIGGSFLDTAWTETPNGRAPGRYGERSAPEALWDADRSRRWGRRAPVRAL